MTAATLNPRSVLHALKPFGRGTQDVESLLSYFCRLAVSHSTSTLNLSRTVAALSQHAVTKNFDWHERQIAGIRESALTWSASLSALTTVPGLDELTFLPWKNVISQNGLSIITKGQFCPECFAEDRTSGRTPYFRLAWESKAVSVCLRHGVRLRQHCPSCGQDKVRHSAAFVVPGWCTKCGAFLGSHEHLARNEDDIESSELWRARQLGDLLAVQHQIGQFPQRQGLIDAINHIISMVDSGQPATFAARVGIAKSTVHHWLRDEGTPTLELTLKIAAQCGVSLTKLIQGDVADWKTPEHGQQLDLGLLHSEQKRRAPAREIEWVAIERQLQSFLLLPTPISVLEAASHLDIEARQLYFRANRTTRMLGERWKAYVKRRQQANVEKAMPQLEAVGREILAQGRAITLREILVRIPNEALSSFPRLFDVLRDVQDRLIAEREYPDTSG